MSAILTNLILKIDDASFNTLNIDGNVTFNGNVYIDGNLDSSSYGVATTSGETLNIPHAYADLRFSCYVVSGLTNLYFLHSIKNVIFKKTTQN